MHRDVDHAWRLYDNDNSTGTLEYFQPHISFYSFRNCLDYFGKHFEASRYNVGRCISLLCLALHLNGVVESLRSQYTCVNFACVNNQVGGMLVKIGGLRKYVEMLGPQALITRPASNY